MRRIATGLCAAGAVLALIVPASAGAAFGPVATFGAGALNHPQSAVSTGAQEFVADTGNGRVVIFSAGGAVDGTLSDPGIAPQDIALAPGSGNIWTASPSRVDVWGVLGIHIAQWSPQGTAYGIVLDPGGTVWVSDVAAGVIRAFDQGGNLLTTIGAGELLAPQGLATDAAGSIYVADTGHGRIVKFSPGGAVQGVWTMPTYTVVANGQTFNGQIEPHDVAVDGAGRVYAPDAGPRSNLVAVFDGGGSLQQVFGAPESDPGSPCPVRTPWGVASSPSGALYVVSTGENLIRVFDEASGPCPTPDFGPGGGVNASGGPPPGASKDSKRPKIKLRKVPKKCARQNFSFRIQATDDGLIRKLLLFINHRRVAKQTPDKQEWTVRVNMPVRKIQRQLPRGTFIRVLIQVRVVDASGKKAKIRKSFRICG
jgi:sugar lactone lactonase YvrE